MDIVNWIQKHSKEYECSDGSMNLIGLMEDVEREFGVTSSEAEAVVHAALGLEE
jgi:NADH:ubiquinone oxidoreductase subunit E